MAAPRPAAPAAPQASRPGADRPGRPDRPDRPARPSAPCGPVGAPGDNGTVKIRDAGSPAATPNNEPKVCGFYVEGFHFDAGQALRYAIVGHGGPNAGPGSLSGSFTTDGTGYGSSSLLSCRTGCTS